MRALAEVLEHGPSRGPSVLDSEPKCRKVSRRRSTGISCPPRKGLRSDSEQVRDVGEPLARGAGYARQALEDVRLVLARFLAAGSPGLWTEAHAVLDCLWTAAGVLEAWLRPRTKVRLRPKRAAWLIQRPGVSSQAAAAEQCRVRVRLDYTTAVQLGSPSHPRLLGWRPI